MAKAQPASPPPSTRIPWIGAALGLAACVLAALSYGKSREIEAAPGSPYYDSAVREAIRGLQGTKPEATPGQRPALPAGVAAEDVVWCEQCQAYHRRQPQPGAAAQAAPGGQSAPTPAPAVQEADIPMTPPPLPAGYDPEDFEWCDNCKAYHRKDAQQAPAAHGQPDAGE